MTTLLLNCVHYIAAVLSYCRHWFLRFHALSFSKTDTCIVQSDARKLKKLPLHIGLLFLEDEISYSDIANLVLWSATMGITFISLYDKNGKCIIKVVYDKVAFVLFVEKRYSRLC